jgi:pantetheine-phosphate adenylyltransferase
MLVSRSIDAPTVHSSSVHRHIALYPGSFDPATFGHLDVIGRGRRLFDELIVGVGRHPGKTPLFALDERVEMLEELVATLPPEAGAAPVRVRSFDGLTVDFAREIGAGVLLRGVRNLSDLAYEVQQAVTNREVAGLETVFIVAGQSFAYTSSSLIRQITAFGEDLDRALSPMCPPSVIARLKRKKAEGHPALMSLRGDGEREA